MILICSGSVPQCKWTLIWTPFVDPFWTLYNCTSGADPVRSQFAIRVGSRPDLIWMLDLYLFRIRPTMQADRSAPVLRIRSRPYGTSGADPVRSQFSIGWYSSEHPLLTFVILAQTHIQSLVVLSKKKTKTTKCLNPLKYPHPLKM